MEVLLIKSDSKILVDEKLETIIQTGKEKTIYSYPEQTMDDILEEASFVSMFGEEKYVLVKNASFFGKSKLNETDTEKLLKYMENPSPLTTLIFITYEDVDTKKNITKSLINKNEYVELKAPKNYELIGVVKQALSLYKIKDEIVRYIIDACLGNYDLIMMEIGKLSLLYKPNDVLKLEDMKQIISSNVNDNIFKFVDAVVAKDAYTSIHLYEDFLNIKTDPLQLINMICREYRLIYLYQMLEKKNYSSKDIASELKLLDWQVNKLRKESSGYHLDDLKEILVNLSKMDYQIKSGQEDKVVAFYAFLVSIMDC